MGKCGMDLNKPRGSTKVVQKGDYQLIKEPAAFS
jgi:hypothetical protein